VHRIYLSTILITCFLVVPHFAFGACDLNATTANFASQLAAAQPGQTLCLASGSYGAFAGVTKASPGVTLMAASGAKATMRIAFTQSSPVPAWLIFDSIWFTGGVGDISDGAHDITFRNSTFADKLTISPGAMNRNNIVFDNDLFNMADNQAGTGGYEARVAFAGGGPNPAGITIKNSKFTTGCADGVGFEGGGMGVTIGPNNEFFNLLQGSCGPHIDSIQFDNSTVPGPTITGNYFHNDSTGIAYYDYVNDSIVTHNIVVNVMQDQISGGSTPNSIVAHNTTDGQIGCGVTHQGNVCKAQIYDNIAGNLNTTTAAPSSLDYNLCINTTCEGSGGHNLRGTPAYVGGAKPTTYTGFALTSTSLGHNAANDGKDIGINVSSAASSAPSAPAGLVATVQ
jgi:hypothetical protein